MRVSIIVPIYNSEKYLSECIDSILNQTYPDIELILINDGSTDDSLKIINEYARNNKNIIVINQENMGASLSRKNGISKSSGDYLMFIDSDDYIEKDTIENLAKIIKRDRVDIVKYEFINRDSWINDILPGIYSDKLELYKKLLTTSDLNSLANEIISKKIINLDDSIFKIKSSVGEDLMMNLYFFDKAKKIEFINQRYYYYRINEDSSTNTYNINRVLNFIKETNSLFEILPSYYKKWDLNDDSILDKIYFNIITNMSSRIKVIVQNDWNKMTRRKLNNTLDNTKITSVDYKRIINVNEKSIVKRVVYRSMFKRHFYLLKLMLKIQLFIKKLTKK